MDTTYRNKRIVAAGGAVVFSVCLAASSVIEKERTVSPQYTSDAIMRPIKGLHSTPWRKILAFGTPGDFILTTNFTKELIVDKILPLFAQARPSINRGSPYNSTGSKRGRKPLLTDIDLLGLVFYYLKTRDPTYRMSIIFGIVPSSIGVWLDFALEVLLQVVTDRSNVDFTIRWPTELEMKASSDLLVHNQDLGGLLSGCFGILDGGRMPCATSGDTDVQNAYWEGFTQAHEVTNLFVFNFFGEIIHAGINFPGSWHDSKVAATSGLYFPKLGDGMPPKGYCLLGNSAFPRVAGELQGKIIRARKSNEFSGRNGVPSNAFLAATEVMLERAMPSERQSAEWGIRSIKGPFKRITVALPNNSYHRKRTLTLVCHLYNYRVRRVGLNQIRTVYADDPCASRLISLRPLYNLPPLPSVHFRVLYNFISLPSVYLIDLNFIEMNGLSFL